MRPHDIDGLAAGQSGKRPDVSSKGSFVARPRTRSRGHFLSFAKGRFPATRKKVAAWSSSGLSSTQVATPAELLRSRMNSSLRHTDSAQADVGALGKARKSQVRVGPLLELRDRPSPWTRQTQIACPRRARFVLLAALHQADVQREHDARRIGLCRLRPPGSVHRLIGIRLLQQIPASNDRNSGMRGRAGTARDTVWAVDEVPILASTARNTPPASCAMWSLNPGRNSKNVSFDAGKCSSWRCGAPLPFVAVVCRKAKPRRQLALKPTRVAKRLETRR